MAIIPPPQRQNIKHTAGWVLLSMAATAKVCDFCAVVAKNKKYDTIEIYNHNL